MSEFGALDQSAEISKLVIVRNCHLKVDSPIFLLNFCGVAFLENFKDAAESKFGKLDYLSN